MSIMKDHVNRPVPLLRRISSFFSDKPVLTMPRGTDYATPAQRIRYQWHYDAKFTEAGEFLSGLGKRDPLAESMGSDFKEALDNFHNLSALSVDTTRESDDSRAD